MGNFLEITRGESLTSTLHLHVLST